MPYTRSLLTVASSVIGCSTGGGTSGGVIDELSGVGIVESTCGETATSFCTTTVT
ncbi:MAG: hypothetical protein F6K56_28655 [Moorea sp. SIO3G5]|nr:hypothetical protein [Moorena sp. SIO3G5]